MVWFFATGKVCGGCLEEGEVAVMQGVEAATEDKGGREVVGGEWAVGREGQEQGGEVGCEKRLQEVVE